MPINPQLSCDYGESINRVFTTPHSLVEVKLVTDAGHENLSGITCTSTNNLQ